MRLILPTGKIFGEKEGIFYGKIPGSKKYKSSLQKNQSAKNGQKGKKTG